MASVIFWKNSASLEFVGFFVERITLLRFGYNVYSRIIFIFANHIKQTKYYATTRSLPTL